MKIEFNDGTPPMEVKVLVTAETVYAVKDAKNLYYLINRERVVKNEKGQPLNSEELSEEFSED